MQMGTSGVVVLTPGVVGIRQHRGHDSAVRALAPSHTVHPKADPRRAQRGRRRTARGQGKGRVAGRWAMCLLTVARRVHRLVQAARVARGHRQVRGALHEEQDRSEHHAPRREQGCRRRPARRRARARRRRGRARRQRRGPSRGPVRPDRVARREKVRAHVRRLQARPHVRRPVSPIDTV